MKAPSAPRRNPRRTERLARPGHVITLAPTGWRRSEVLNLEERDITQDGGAASMESANYRDRRSRPELPPRSCRGRHVQLAPVRVSAITLTMGCWQSSVPPVSTN
jgi:hypothetical protein